MCFPSVGSALYVRRRTVGARSYSPLTFHIWNIPPRYVGGEAYINVDAGGGAAQSSRRRCSVALGSRCVSASARVRRHGLKRYVRARDGRGAPTRGLVPAQRRFCVSVRPGADRVEEILVPRWRETVAKGGRGRPMSPSCFAALAPRAGREVLPSEPLY